MGRSYWFECPKCSYRAKVSGRADRGLGFCVQTILCRDCKELYDAVTRLKVPDESGGLRGPAGFDKARFMKAPPVMTAPPNFQAVLNRLIHTLPPGISELMTHPGECDEQLRRKPTRLLESRKHERDLLVSPDFENLLRSQEIVLTHYGEIAR